MLIDPVARSPAKPRRSPKQARSRERVDAILDAAEAVFLERGFATATTNQIAARAGTSIGSLYRFFPNKEALLVALAERFAQRMLAIGAEVTNAGDERTLEDKVSDGIDRFNAFLVENPGFRILIEHGDNPALSEGRARYEQAMAGLIGRGHDLGQDPEGEAVGHVLNVVLSNLQLLSVSRDEAFRQRVLRHAKRMVTLFMEDLLS